MRYNSVGRTGLNLSEVSFGAGTSAGLMIHGDIDAQVAAVHAALDAGINHFDTAAFYGYGSSEIYLGQALRTAGAKDALVTSKVAVGREFMETRRLRAAVRQSVEQSLLRLRRERIDVLLMHNATHRTHAPYDAYRESERVAAIMNTYLPGVTFDDLMGEGAIVEEVELLVREGKVGAFGLSGQDNDPVVVRALIASGRIQIFNQSYNLLNPSAGFPEARQGRKVDTAFATDQNELFIEFDDVIESARAAGVGVSVISPMAAGALTDSAEMGEPAPKVSKRINRFPFKGQFDKQVGLARLFKPIADRHGMRLSELAVRFVLSTPGVTTLVAGLSSVEQVMDLASAAGKAPLNAEIQAELRAVWFASGLATAGARTTQTD